MKKLKNSFALLIALVTIGFTLMSNKSKTVGKSEALNTVRCYRPNITFKTNCSQVQNTLYPFDLCAYASTYQGSHIFNLDPNSYVEEADIATECYGLEAFCCAQVVKDFEPCFGQPAFNLEGYIDYYKIAQVYCKWNDN